jgi:hypothetical protein
MQFCHTALWTDTDKNRYPSLENADHLPNDTVCTLAQLLGHIVPFIHYKVLVEDLEDLPTL